MRARNLFFIRALLLAVVLLTATTAYAETDAEKAAELYKSGVDLYFAEDYGLAISKFKSGYALDPNPMFLYSLSLCFSKLQNFEQALVHAEQAKAAGGMQPDVATKNDARLASFAVAISGTEIADAIVASQVPEGPPTCATNSDCDAGEVCNMRRGLCVQELPDTEPSEPLFSPVGWAGVGASAAGIGMLVGGGVVSLTVKKNQDRFDIVSDPGNPEFDAAERDDLDTKLTSQKSLGRILVLGGVGLTAVGVGLIVVDLFVLGKSDDDKQTAQWTPLLLPGGAGVGWSTRF